MTTNGGRQGGRIATITAIVSWIVYAAFPAHAATAPAVLSANSPIYIAAESDGSWSQCTLAALGTSRKGSLFGLTAGHCGERGDQIFLNDAGIRRRVGVITSTLSRDAGDLAIARIDPGVEVSRRVSLAGSAPQPILGVLSPSALAGHRVCSQGASSGAQCGEVTTAGLFEIDVATTTREGDSGAGLFVQVPDGVYLAGVHVAAGGTGVPVNRRLSEWGIDVTTPHESR